jgi:hypothetical protein
MARKQGGDVVAKLVSSLSRQRLGCEFPNRKRSHVNDEGAHDLKGVGVFDYVISDAGEHGRSLSRAERISRCGKGLFWHLRLIRALGLRKRPGTCSQCVYRKDAKASKLSSLSGQYGARRRFVGLREFGRFLICMGRRPGGFQRGTSGSIPSGIALAAAQSTTPNAILSGNIVYPGMAAGSTHGVSLHDKIRRRAGGCKATGAFRDRAGLQ